MSGKGLLGPTAALLLVLGPGGAPEGSAAPAPKALASRAPVYLLPVTDADATRPDALLTRAFRAAVTLRVAADADWHLRAPGPGDCLRGCAVVTIRGRRIPEPRYVLELRLQPGDRLAGRAELSVPSQTPLTLLADALLLKASFLLGVDLTHATAPPPPPPPTAPPPPPPPTAPPPPRASPVLAPVARSVAAPPSPAPALGTALTARRRAAPRRRDRLELSLGTGSALGLDADYVTTGLDLGVALRLWGPLWLRLETSYQQSAGTTDPRVSWRALPVALLLAARWAGSRWAGTIAAGATTLVLWLDFRETALVPEGTHKQLGLSGGLTAAARVSVRLWRGLTLALAVRATWLASRVKSEVSFVVTDPILFRLPRGLLHPSLEVGWVF